jgi:glutamate dehydrogenase (NADP+)
MTIAVQGFGNAGYHFARLAHEAGYNIVGVSDSKGGIVSKDGLDPAKIMHHKRTRRELKAMVYCDASVCEEASHETLNSKEFLAQDVDILVLAALENQINKENAEQIKARHILEIANGPVTPEADNILAEKGVTVLPDILCNAGGVAVSYFEWVQNRTGYYWIEAQIDARLANLMQVQTDKVLDFAQSNKTTIRTAAYTLGVGRIATAMKAKGTVDYFGNGN